MQRVWGVHLPQLEKGGLHSMRPINVSLDSVTWELAKQKTNFSQWVRDKLRSERNAKDNGTRYCRYCGKHHPIQGFFDHVCMPGSEEE